MALAAATFALAACSGPAAHGTAATTRSTATTFQLPGSLIGLNQTTAATATQATQNTISAMTAKGIFANPSAAAYQNVSGGPEIVVFGGVLKSELTGDLASFAKGFAAGMGAGDARSFAAGPMGGVLECGGSTVSGHAVVACAWTDRAVIGGVLYVLGAASSLNDAASKTVQIRSAVEG